MYTQLLHIPVYIDHPQNDILCFLLSVNTILLLVNIILLLVNIIILLVNIIQLLVNIILLLLDIILFLVHIILLLVDSSLFETTNHQHIIRTPWRAMAPVPPSH